MNNMNQIEISLPALSFPFRLILLFHSYDNLQEIRKRWRIMTDESKLSTYFKLVYSNDTSIFFNASF